MVKLYYTPTSCAASSFICAFIAELKFECEVVDLLTHTTESGIDFYSINPKGNVPTIVLDDGTVLNENISCLEYIADNSIKVKLAPEKNTNERLVVRQLLSFLASELHSSIGLFFNPNMKKSYGVESFVRSIFNDKMKYLQKHILKGNKYAYGTEFSIVDAYLLIILSWTGYVGINLEEYPVAYEYYMKLNKENIIKTARNRMALIPRFIK